MAKSRGVFFIIAGDVYKTSKRNYQYILRRIRDDEGIENIDIAKCKLVAENPRELTDLLPEDAQDLLDDLD